MIVAALIKDNDIYFLQLYWLMINLRDCFVPCKSAVPKLFLIAYDLWTLHFHLVPP